MRLPLPFPFATMVGFLAVVGSFAGGLALAFGRDTAPSVAAGPAPEPESADTVQVYHPLPDQLVVTLPNGRTAATSVTLSVKAPMATLLDLKATATAHQADIMAALLEAAQATAQTEQEATALRSALPLRLADVLNERLGSDDVPKPVKEVLLTDFLLR